MGRAFQNCAEPWMAEPKRHRDVPKERVLEAHPQTNQPPEPEASWTRLPTPRPHRPTICHQGPNTRTRVYKCLPLAVYMCLPVIMTNQTTTDKARQANAGVQQ